MDKTDKNRADCISGVCCAVESCVHHARGGQCTAPHIDVKNEAAQTKAETFCGTFKPAEQRQRI